MKNIFTHHTLFSQWLKKSFSSQFYRGIFFIIYGVIFFFFNSSAVFAKNISLHTLDSIAGYGTEITIQNADPLEDLSLFITTPLPERLEFPITANKSGIAHFILPEKNTLESGKYTVSIGKNKSEAGQNDIQTFEIFADETSPTISKIKTETLSLSTNATGKITVLLQDKYGNPVIGHRVSLISSRSEDTIERGSEERTNIRGEIYFTISSPSEGNATFSAFDETSGISLEERKSILFYQNGIEKKSSTNISPSIFSANIFAGGDEDNISRVSDFRIDFPEIVSINSDENFLTITAVDTEGETVENFTGSILIQIPSDENAQIPGQNGKYTFLKHDQGTFTFSRSLVFSSIGKHTIEVFLFDEDSEEINVNVFGKKEVLVNEKQTEGSTQEGSTFKILTPNNNATFSSSSLVVSGISNKNSEVKIFLDDILMTSVSSDSKGAFESILENLEDGKHTLYAVQGEGEELKSSPVSFTISASFPEIINPVFSPESVPPLEKVSLSLKTSLDVKTVEVYWENESKFLEKTSTNDESLEWKISFQAPATVGSYPLTIIAKNSNGNTTKKNVAKELVVEKSSTTPSTQTLTGFFNADKKAIILSWEAPKDINPILYILNTGSSSETLKKTKSVSGTTQTIEWKNFTPGEKMFFSITPVNETGEEENSSRIIAVQTEKEEEKTPVKKPPIVVTPPVVIDKDPDFFIQENENSLQIQWDKTKNAKEYEILYGLESGVYGGKKEFNNSITSFTLKDLLPNTQYYIRLRAKDSLDNVIFDYGEKVGLTGKSVFHSAPIQVPQNYPEWITETGPKLFLALAAIFFLFGGTLLMRKE